jgi:hypothetical protein
MKIPSELFTRLRAVFTKPALDADFEAELAQHLEAATADGIRSGMTPVEARRQARIALGGLTKQRNSTATPVDCRGWKTSPATCALRCACCGDARASPSSPS